MESSLAEKFFQKNVERYAKTAPQVALRLHYVNCEKYPFASSRDGSLNFKIDGSYVHSVENPLQEAQEWFSGLNLQDKEILFVYGVGLGYYYNAAQKWLKESKKHQMVFVEDDMACLCRLFETDLGYKILNDKQAHIFYFPDTKDKIVFDEISWMFFGSPLHVSALKLYEEKKREVYTELLHKLPYDAVLKKNIVDEYLYHGAAFFRNFYPNILQLPNSFLGNKFFGKFKGMPAIICGAGPSLNKQLGLLKALKDKALIFSGGSSLNALNFEGIQPHFGAGIDPNEEQFKRISENSAVDVPFFYRSRMNHRAFMAIRGPKLYITGAGGYQIADWFKKQLKIKGKDIEEGHNVINFCLEIAHAMGCNPIIFIGMDLAYTDMKAYSPGVITDAKVDQSMMDEWLIKKDIFGKDVYTEWKWVAESKWISQFAEEHPGVKLINATEGGIGFEGVVNMSFGDAVGEYLISSHDFTKMVREKIESSPLKNVTLKKIKKLLDQLSSSLERCIEYLQILEEEENARKEQMEKGLMPQQTGREALAETELQDEVAYRYILDFFNTVYLHVISRDIKEIRELPTLKKEIKKIRSNKKRYRFLKRTAQVNLELIRYSLK